MNFEISSVPAPTTPGGGGAAAHLRRHAGYLNNFSGVLRRASHVYRYGLVAVAQKSFAPSMIRACA
jgi:hypothetical protein